LGVTVDTIYRLRNSGRIKGYKLVKTYRFSLAEVKAALAAE
jgi:excisionase family DNA binding protein